MGFPINLFIVDDSAVVRTTLAAMLQSERDIALAGTAGDPLIAMDRFARDGWPDVIILDIEMPRMDGLTFLRKIMQERPTPVIICSSVAQSGSRNALEALSLGAVEVIAKPEVGLKVFFSESRAWLLHVIRAAGASEVKGGLPRSCSLPARREEGADGILPLKATPAGSATHPLIAVGASTGGVRVLETILPLLPQKCAPILITQHMPAGFTRTLAERLDKMSAVSVKEAEDGDRVLAGRVLIAPGNRHMTLQRSGNSYVVGVRDGPRINHHKPSVDILFRSCANEAGPNAVAFLLTGMGDDGARGLKEMRQRGAKTYVQEAKSCTVYGMPKVAADMGAALGQLTPEEIVETIKRI